MSIASDCGACMAGNHEQHDRDHGIRPGVIGGAYCDCSGDCADRARARGEEFRALLTTPPADTASTGADVEALAELAALKLAEEIWEDEPTDAEQLLMQRVLTSDWLAAHDAATAERVRRETAEGIAFLMSGVGSHREPCRLPDTPCLCGVCEFREEAAQIAREQAR